MNLEKAKSSVRDFMATVHDDPRINGDIALTRAREAMPALSQLLEAVTWIKCSERMPEDGVRVLVRPYYNMDEVTGTHWRDHWNFAHSVFIDDADAGITHWMPLPSPPEDTK